MAGENVLNYRQQGGANTVIGGCLAIASGGCLSIQSGGTLNVASGGNITIPSGGKGNFACGTLYLPALAFNVVTGNGTNGAGNVTVVGSAVGDRVIAAIPVDGANYTASAANGFGGTVLAANTVQQTHVADLSGTKFVFLLSAVPA